MRAVLRSKIQNVTVTEANLEYQGSVTIDESLMKKADIWEGEKVLISSVTTGRRLETYTIKGEMDSGVICMNGPAAHLIKKGENITIMAFEYVDEEITAKKILADEENKFLKYL
ncbi:MAG: aspartate 1-decarboxylase [bacterium]|nr:aspartate 1-decarboxylase [bacterium]